MTLPVKPAGPGSLASMAGQGPASTRRPSACSALQAGHMLPAGGQALIQGAGGVFADQHIQHYLGSSSM